MGNFELSRLRNLVLFGLGRLYTEIRMKITISRRLVLLGLLWLGSAPVMSGEVYLAPVGIPSPSFGITQEHFMYAGRRFEAGGFAYKDAGNGPYSHYVDNSRSCQDLFNPYGDIDSPRCTVPTELPAGSVVEIHGGSYPSLVVNEAKGNASQPIFIRGYSRDSRPTIVESPGIYISHASYLIVENLVTDGRSLSAERSSGGLVIRQPSDHVSVRYVESRNYPMPEFCPKRKGGVGCWFGTVWGVGADKKWKRDEIIEDIVLYKNHIHHNGDYVPRYESGRHAINVSGGTRRVWILDNVLEYNAEDGIQVYWKKGGSRGEPAEKVYIGRNIIRNNGENAVDIKQAFDVIVSGNEMYGYHRTDFPASGSDGSAVVLNDDAPNDRLWIINNRIHDSSKAVRSQTKGRAYVIGNVIYGISDGKREPSSPGRAYGVAIWSSSAKEFYALNNTIYDASGGIYANHGREIYVRNNIVADLGLTSNTERGYHITLNRKNFSIIKVDHNLLFQGGGKIRLRGVKCEQGCILGESVRFVDEKGGDFSLQKDSPAIDAGARSNKDPFSVFELLYGLDIKQDLVGHGRPLGNSFDIGAYEYKEM